MKAEHNLERVRPMAAKLTKLALVFRANSGLCSPKAMQSITQQAKTLGREIAFII